MNYRLDSIEAANRLVIEVAMQVIRYESNAVKPETTTRLALVAGKCDYSISAFPQPGDDVLTNETRRTGYEDIHP